MANSQFFARALQGAFREATEQVVSLPDDDPAVFDMYLQFCYKSKIFCGFPRSYVGFDRIYKALVNAYVFGDKVQDPDFANAVMNTFIYIIAKNRYSSSLDEDIVALIYENTLVGSPLRQAVIDHYVWRARPEWMDAIGAKVAYQDFMKDLNAGLLHVRETLMEMPGVSSKASKISDQVDNLCRYHVHAEGEKCRKN